ncbi:MAG TPA: hypothetical protein VEU94_17340 [Terriglobales bacterium]|nr:hypothetical protein [Terriglobales bacterium]
MDPRDFAKRTDLRHFGCSRRREFVRDVPAQETGGIGVNPPLPGFIEPAPAFSIEKVPGGERWVHEILPQAWKEIAGFPSFGCAGVGWVYLIVWAVTLQI